MNVSSRGKILVCTSLVVILVASSLGVLLLPSTAASASYPSSPVCRTNSLASMTLVSTPPTGAKGPDDITRMAVKGLDGGKELIWTAFQNGINPNGTPGTSGGPTQSIIAGYDPSTGTLIRAIPVTGHVDGLTADPGMSVLIATANEDANSTFNLIYPALGAVATYTYDPNPAVSGVGGSDSIAILDGNIYVSHSNPLDTSQPTVYSVKLDLSTTLTASLKPVFYDNSMATNALTGKSVQLGLTDPDTNFVMPHSSPRFGGDLATISQGDGKIIFASMLTGNPHLWVLSVTDNIRGNVPPIDGLAVATSNHGTLYVVDSAAGTIQALATTGCQKGTVFISEPSDNGNPLLGTLNLYTGKITPLDNQFQSPKGLLFVSAN